MDKKNTFKHLELLTESQLIEEQSNWDGQQWHDFFTQEGEMTIDEFSRYAKQEILKERKCNFKGSFKA